MGRHNGGSRCTGQVRQRLDQWLMRGWRVRWCAPSWRGYDRGVVLSGYGKTGAFNTSEGIGVERRYRSAVMRLMSVQRRGPTAMPCGRNRSAVMVWSRCHASTSVSLSSMPFEMTKKSARVGSTAVPLKMSTRTCSTLAMYVFVFPCCSL